MNGEKAGEEKHGDEGNQCSDKALRLQEDLAVWLCYDGRDGRVTSVCRVDLGFSLAPVKSCKAVTLDVRGYRSLNCYLTYIAYTAHNLIWDSPQTSVCVTVLMSCSLCLSCMCSCVFEIYSESLYPAELHTLSLHTGAVVVSFSFAFRSPLTPFTFVWPV